MSNVETTAERDLIDLDHFVYSTGSIGSLKTLSVVPVVAGDSFQLDVVGAFRLSPLRRGLSVDARVEFFSFYIPHRHSYGWGSSNEFVDLMKKGIPASGPAPILSTHDVPKFSQAGVDKSALTGFLGTHYNHDTGKIPKYLMQGYIDIYNNYFKVPYHIDSTVAALENVSLTELRDGLRCNHLDAIWSRVLNPSAEQTHKFADMAGNDGIDIIGLNQAYGVLNTQQERNHFMQRYRDVVNSFGGSTNIDADNRPHLLMHTPIWTSGYDVDGTTTESLGQFSGRVQQPFQHSVPTFYVPEHGAIFTLVLVRFPSTHQREMHTFVGKAGLDYIDIACDPAIIGNFPPSYIDSKFIFSESTATNYKIFVPAGQPYRFHPSYVDDRYRKLLGFPFSNYQYQDADSGLLIDPAEYDQCFQTSQLGHWNIQSKFVTNVRRRIPSARDSIMTN